MSLERPWESPKAFGSSLERDPSERSTTLRKAIRSSRSNRRGLGSWELPRCLPDHGPAVLAVVGLASVRVREVSWAWEALNIFGTLTAPGCRAGAGSSHLSKIFKLPSTRRVSTVLAEGQACGGLRHGPGSRDSWHQLPTSSGILPVSPAMTERVSQSESQRERERERE